MRITLCGSIAFHDEMIDVQKRLEERGHVVQLPPSEVLDDKGHVIPVKQFYQLRKNEQSDTSWVWEKKSEHMRNHLKKIELSDGILVLNYDKKGIQGYVGVNTLLEMALAFHLNKKIFLLNKLPDIEYKEELLGMKPTAIEGDLTKIC